MNPIDTIMEKASFALWQRQYQQAEALSLEALSQARQNQEWDAYARILLPLQECRRQRRLIAASGAIRLGTTNLAPQIDQWDWPQPDGCIVVTRPHGVEHARRLAAAALTEQGYRQVLLADQAAQSPRWRLRSFAGREVDVEFDAPPPDWLDRWLLPEAHKGDEKRAAAADWFLDAAEALGDAALAGVRAELGTLQRVKELESCLQVVADHELILQGLAQAARALTGASGSTGTGSEAGPIKPGPTGTYS